MVTINSEDVIMLYAKLSRTSLYQNIKPCFANKKYDVIKYMDALKNNNIKLLQADVTIPLSYSHISSKSCPFSGPDTSIRDTFISPEC